MSNGAVLSAGNNYRVSKIALPSLFSCCSNLYSDSMSKSKDNNSIVSYSLSANKFLQHPSVGESFGTENMRTEDFTDDLDEYYNKVEIHIDSADKRD